MDNQELIDELTERIERKTRDLSDEGYIEVLEGISANLDASVQAKREELENAE